MRRPTEKQLARLSILARPGIVIPAPTRHEWRPLLQRGLVETPAWTNGGDNSHAERYLPPLLITPDGLRAIADFRDREGHWPGEGGWFKPGDEEAA